MTSIVVKVSVPRSQLMVLPRLDRGIDQTIRHTTVRDWIARLRRDRTRTMAMYQSRGLPA